MENENITPSIEGIKTNNPSSLKRKFFAIILVILIIVALIVILLLIDNAMNLNTSTIKETNVKTILPSPSVNRSWQTYIDDSVLLRYPQDFVEEKVEKKDEEYNKTFTKRQNESTSILTFKVYSNSIRENKKHYTSIQDYLGSPYAAMLVAGGLEGGQVCPHAGCENKYDATFLSNDYEKVYYLSLQIGTDAENESGKIDETAMRLGKELFNEILNQMRFSLQTYIDPTSLNSSAKIYKHSSCGIYDEQPFSIQIPSNWTEKMSGGVGAFYTEYLFQDNNNFALSVTCGSGFGDGQCPIPESKFTINNQEVNGCLQKDEQGKTISFQAYLRFGSDQPAFVFQIHAIESNENLNLIRKTLSTFKLSPKEQN